MRKALSAFFLIVASGAALVVAQHLWTETEPSHLLQEYLNQDMATLAAEHKLPPEWKKIRDVEIEFLSDEARKWKNDFALPVEKNPEGGYRLEVELDSWEDGADYGAVLHFHIVNLTGDKTIWELGRTYRLGKK